jgi:hypothetical protein
MPGPTFSLGGEILAIIILFFYATLPILVPFLFFLIIILIFSVFKRENFKKTAKRLLPKLLPVSIIISVILYFLIFHYYIRQF